MMHVNELEGVDHRTARNDSPWIVERSAGAMAGGQPLPLRDEILSAVLEQVDLGIMVISAERRPVFANRAALRACGHRAPLRLELGVLRAAARADAAEFAHAMQQALRGLRSLLTFDAADTEIRSLAILPLRASAAERDHLDSVGVALLIFGRPQMCDSLSIECFARQHGMTLAESAILSALCNGMAPRRIAQDRGVAVSTIRTHVVHILEKSGARNITGLLRLAAMLPPLVTPAI